MKSRYGFLPRIAIMGCVVVAAGGVAAERAAAAPPCSRPPAPGPMIDGLPWAQRSFPPERVGSLSRGGGVRVAVVDTGVDPRHPQLKGRIQPGFDELSGQAGGDIDCDGHGTGVASVIVAEKVPGVGFAGLAPDAQVLPVRVADSGVGQQTGEVSATNMAKAITWAANNQARVINVSIYFTVPNAEIKAAVEYAQAQGALVVAAVGNHHKADGPPDLTPYPAAYPGVVGVGAIGEDAIRLPDSYVGPHVDLVAPGGNVTTAVPGGGHKVQSGTSFAAPFVSATAALLFAADPDLTADEVGQRLIATADPAVGPTDEYGHGVVNPYRALTERAADGPMASAPPVHDEPADPAALARERRWRADTVRAAAAAAVVGVLALLLVVAGPIARRGRRGRWRARRPAPTVETRATDDLEQRFYDVPRP